MEGYIIDFKPVKEEDLIVTVLSEHTIESCYRFYGARHSTIHIGYKIDFELEYSLSGMMPRLKDVMHLNFPWLLNHQKLYNWQRYIKLFYVHLKDVYEIDSFYFELLEHLVMVMAKQDSKRAICESYVRLLEFEGRLHKDLNCFLCEQPIDSSVCVVRSFLVAHPECTYGKSFNTSKMREFFQDKHLICFNDDEVEYLWNILLQGI